MENVPNQDIVDQLCEETMKHVRELYEKYQTSPYMLSKTKNLICYQSAHILKNIMTTHEDRVIRMETLSSEQDIFIDAFLNNNQYFYIANTEKFFYYDSNHYFALSEDDIIHRILTLISQGRQLMSWKQKTKVNIMKRIKETSLLKTVPESDTIQSVLNALYPVFFNTKSAAKYFLTVLGDNLLKKNIDSDIVHFVQPITKSFIRKINEQSLLYFGSHIFQTFRYKYHDHDYSNCRLIYFQDSVKNEDLWKTIINNQLLDILCVAVHYSTRYGSSDDYILKYCNESDFIRRVFYLRDCSQEELVRQFVAAYLIMPRSRSGSGTFITNTDIDTSVTTNPNTQSGRISWKNMQYLWKHYLNSQNLPTIMYQQTLKTQLLADSLKEYYVLEEDVFQGVFSRHLPHIQRFMQFWEENMVEDSSETDFELDELSFLFKKWNTSQANKNKDPMQITDVQMLDIIEYYYPNIPIEKSKYINHMRCILWDKQMDIQIALEYIKGQLRNHEDMIRLIPGPVSIHDIYIQYCKYFSTDSTQGLRDGLIASKSYFEKYVFEHYSQFVIDSSRLSIEWYLGYYV